MHQEQREELEMLRGQLSEAIADVHERISYGSIDAETGERELTERFGPDYFETLSIINQQLHARPIRTAVVEHPRLALSVVLAVLCVSFISLWASPLLTGAVLAEQEMVLTLFDEEPERIAETGRIVITGIEAAYTGPGNYGLYLEDGARKHLLYADETCYGCNASYRAPYLLELESGGGSLRIDSLTYRRS